MTELSREDRMELWQVAAASAVVCSFAQRSRFDTRWDGERVPWPEPVRPVIVRTGLLDALSERVQEVSRLIGTELEGNLLRYVAWAAHALDDGANFRDVYAVDGCVLLRGGEALVRPDVYGRLTIALAAIDFEEVEVGVHAQPEQVLDAIDKLDAGHCCSMGYKLDPEERARWYDTGTIEMMDRAGLGMLGSRAEDLDDLGSLGNGLAKEEPVGTAYPPGQNRFLNDDVYVGPPRERDAPDPSGLAARSREAMIESPNLGSLGNGLPGPARKDEE